MWNVESDATGVDESVGQIPKEPKTYQQPARSTGLEATTREPSTASDTTVFVTPSASVFTRPPMLLR